MSIDIMNRLWWRDFDGDVAPIAETHPGSGKNLKWTLIAMGDMASDDGFCWPAVATIALKASLSERSVQMALRQAEALGILRRRDRRDASTQFVFNLDRLPHVERPHRAKERGPIDEFKEEPDLFDTGESPAPVSKGRVQSVRGTGAGDSPTGAGAAPRNVIETSEESSSGLSGDLQSPAPAESLVEMICRRWATIVGCNEGRISSIRKIDDGLRHMIEVRGRQHAHADETPMDVWNTALDNIASSRFLRGLVPPGPGRLEPFRLSLSWAAKAANFREIVNGKYNAERDPTRVDQRTGRLLGPTDAAVASTIDRMRSAREGRGYGGGAGSTSPR